LLHLRDYVAAAKDVDESALAATQIYEMARLVADSEFLGAAADALDSLDFSTRADEVREWARGGGSADALSEADALSGACLKKAVNTNDPGE
jgi:hypothetical protein